MPKKQAQYNVPQELLAAPGEPYIEASHIAEVLDRMEGETCDRVVLAAIAKMRRALLGI